jgi:hypothetical protein
MCFMAFCASAGLKYSIYAKPVNNERNHISGPLVTGTLKCMEYEPILALFQGFEPLFGR